MMCGRFILSAARERLIRAYLPRRLILQAPDNSAAAAAPGTRAQVAGLVGLMRAESATENLGGLAMLNALSTALFAVALRLASEVTEPPDGLLALAGNPRLVPALTALFNEPARAWTLPELARRCNMSRATFIRHFQERLGRSASNLLTDIRMTVAANALKTSYMSTGAVAELAGYQGRPLSNRRAHLSRRPWTCSARRNVFVRYSRSVGDCSGRNADDCSKRDSNPRSLSGSGPSRGRKRRCQVRSG
jgi:AraC family transcriptional regulator, activator of mtrCDE